MTDRLGEALDHDDWRHENGMFASDPTIVAAARSWHTLPSLIRQFAFDIVMTELGMNDDDMDDQADATERVDAWMKHWDALSVTPTPEDDSPTPPIL